MTTPTDDEIVKYVLAQDWGYAETAVRQALRLAREGLPVPVKDEAVDLHNALEPCVGGHERIRAISQFLAERDAERDEAVAELRKAADCARISLKNSGYDNEWTRNLSAALAKLEPKP